jgi:hypothetical protein
MPDAEPTRRLGPHPRTSIPRPRPAAEPGCAATRHRAHERRDVERRGARRGSRSSRCSRSSTRSTSRATSCCRSRSRCCSTSSSAPWCGRWALAHPRAGAAGIVMLGCWAGRRWRRTTSRTGAAVGGGGAAVLGRDPARLSRILRPVAEASQRPSRRRATRRATPGRGAAGGGGARAERGVARVRHHAAPAHGGARGARAALLPARRGRPVPAEADQGAAELPGQEEGGADRARDRGVGVHLPALARCS